MALFEFGDYSYQEITLKEKLLEVLSYLLRIGDFKQYAGKTILNNVYMDLRGKKPVFKRTKTAMERNNIFATIRRYAKKLKPQYNGDVYLETVRCYFDISQENLEKCRYTYQGNETYAFLMSDKYIMALYTHCLVTRKKAAMQGTQIEGFTEKEYGIERIYSPHFYEIPLDFYRCIIQHKYNKIKRNLQNVDNTTKMSVNYLHNVDLY